jgi:hypothetical protein
VIPRHPLAAVKLCLVASGQASPDGRSEPNFIRLTLTSQIEREGWGWVLG